jgi:hypothetical protein
MPARSLLAAGLQFGSIAIAAGWPLACGADVSSRPSSTARMNRQVLWRADRPMLGLWDRDVE